MDLMLISKGSKTTFLQKNRSQVSQLALGTKSSDFNHWTQFKQVKTSSNLMNCRFHHSSVLNGKDIFVYGGYDNNNGILCDFQMFVNDNSLKSKWIALTTENGPGPRHSHSSVIHNGIIYIFGGKVDRFNSTNHIHAYSIKDKKWTKILAANTESQGPGPTDSHQAVIFGDEMIIYGGFCNNQFTNILYSFNIPTKRWQKLYPPSFNSNKSYLQQPQPRSDFSMVVYNQKLYIYAGKNLYKSFSDLWEFDLKLRKFTRILCKNQPRQHRSGHSAIVYKNQMIVFGGIESVTHERDDLLSFSFETKEWRVIWTNSEEKYNAEQQYRKKNKPKKISSCTKPKSPESCLTKTKFQEKQKEQPRKYRRPLAQQKHVNIKIQVNHETDRSKKEKERKIMLINDIQSTVLPTEQNYSARYSPLIESLTNSIMLTSSIHNNSGTMRETGMHKQLTQANQQSEYEKGIQRRLKARDGHTAHILDNQMLIFGGDRHMIAINDVAYLNLQLLLNKKQRQVRSYTQQFDQDQRENLSLSRNDSGQTQPTKNTN